MVRKRLSVASYLSGTVQRQDVKVSLDWVHGVELHVEEEEDESVERWAEAVTKPSDARYHPLDDACRSSYRSC